MKACCVPARSDGPAPEADATTQQPGARPAAPPPQRADLVALPGGAFTMGSDDGDGFAADGEGPARRVVLSPFAIAATTVTNAEFNRFVRATQHVTDAERHGHSFVFYLQVSEAVRRGVRRLPAGLPWWLPVEGACWQRPEGPGSQIADRGDHPVVHVSWHDASAYCAWAGVVLPSEAQWEYAARGRLEGRRYPWGDGEPEASEDGDERRRCNIWRGSFPNRPAAPWKPGTLPAGALAPNGFGLHQMAGNVWEWCADWFSPGYHAETANHDPLQARVTGARALRGGSFLCHRSYCNRYRVAGRSSNAPSSAASNIGFRVAAPLTA